MADIGSRQPVAPIKRGNTQRRTWHNGKEVIEQIPATPYTRKMVDPNGIVKMVVLASGRTIGGTADNPYGNQKLQEKIAKGWLPYSECPVGKYIKAQGEVPCEGTDPQRPGVFSKPHPNHRHALIEDECCKHIEGVIASRQEVYLAEQRRIAEQSEGSLDKLVKRMESQMKRELEMASPERRNAAIFGSGAREEVLGDVEE